MDQSTPRERHMVVSIARQMPLNTGATWFVISRKWFQAWEVATLGVPNKAFAEVSEATLGPVDNSEIVHPGTSDMLPALVEGYQIELVPEDAWKHLVQWYGNAPIVLPREVIAYPTASGLLETRVEVYPPSFHVFLLAPKSNDPIPHAEISISSCAPLSALVELAASTLHIPTSRQYRLWNMPPITPKAGVAITDVERGTLLLVPRDESIPLTDFGRMGRVFAIETCGSDGQWLLDSESVSVPVDASKGVDFGSATENVDSSLPFRGRVVGPPVPRGTMGFQNLGHTCFMNAGLQCLLHIPELERYFLDNLYQRELNPNNPLSREGKFAAAFSVVMHQMYPAIAKPAPRKNDDAKPSASAISAFRSSRQPGSSSSYAPRDFKQTLCQYAPVFAGYEEGDSQELIVTLLDGLHEDLNRILKKPFVERPDWPEDDSGMDRNEVEARIARETWEGHARRNDSIIADLFQGMYKSTLTCMNCGKLSITFDPFMSLALPLPATGGPWRHTVHYVPWDVQKPSCVVKIELPNDSTTLNLKQKLADGFGVDQLNLVVSEVWKHKFFKFFDDDSNVNEIHESDVLIVYELPIPAILPGSNLFHPGLPLILPVLHVSSNSSFGTPFLIVLDLKEAGSFEEVYRAVTERYSRWIDPHGLSKSEQSSAFKLHTFGTGGDKIETGFRLGIPPTRLEALESREPTSASEKPLVKSNEAIVCDWPIEIKEKVFPIPSSPFEKWEPHVLPKSIATPLQYQSGERPINLEDCLDELTKAEQLSVSDSWYCSRCKQHRQAVKELKLWTTPNILVLQIKRFAKRNKIDDLVTFPVHNLDLSKWMGPPGREDNWVYDLFAVDQHMGGNLSTGAYSTYAKNESDGQWYHYEDAVVNLSTPEKAINPGAYLLFYRRRSTSADTIIDKAKLHIDTKSA